MLVDRGEKALEQYSGACDVTLADLQLDVRDYHQVQELVDETVKRTGKLDYLFNNAGIVIGGDAILYTIDDWNQVIDVNLKGVIHGVQAAYLLMAKQGFGHIINTASIGGLTPCPGMVSYATAKHAIVGLSASLKIEAESLGVKVSVLCPGAVRTPILVNGCAYGKMLRDIPLEVQQARWEKLKPLPADIFAKKALTSNAKNKLIIIESPLFSAFWRIYRFFQALYGALIRASRA